MQKDINDQELTLKKRARRRLVGAIALVLFMVIVLPMILKDRSNKQPADEVTITLNDNKPAVLPEVSDFDSNIVPSNTVPFSEESVDSITQQSADQSETAEDDAEASPKPQVESKSNDNQKAAVKLPAVKQTETPKTDSKKSTSNAKFYVQIGVFSDEANVKKLQAKLTDLGYKSQTEKIDTAKGKKIRLRTQLLGERNDAAIALQNIKDAGLTGMVVSQ
ncbi:MULTISPECIES: SPOR domain-containing protein [Methylotenera]|uniref:SPOR domain-containing protein n=1 Tax=Methylotenera TaxID=359407 RepID=UPI00037181F6|nr:MULTISPECIES: SPOR domain-containing protein [Methylotenera]